MKNKVVDKKILKILIPAILENALLTISSMVLTSYIGRLAVEEINAYGLGNRIFNLYFNVFKGFSIGGMLLIAIAFGKDDRNQCAKIQKVNYLVVLPIAIIVSILLFWKSEIILKIMTDDSNLLAESMSYLRIIIISFPLVALVHLNSAAFQASGNTRIPLFIAGIGNLVNIVIGYVLIFGIGPVKGGNIIGAAWAQNIEYLVMFLVGLYLLYGKDGLFYRCCNSVRQDGAEITKKIFVAGIPAAIENSFWALAMIFMSSVILSYGQNYYASFQLGLQVEGFCDMMSAGFLTAAISLSANSIGARDDNMYRFCYKRLNHYCIIICCITITFLAFFSKQVLSFLTNKPELIRIAAVYLYTMIWSQYAQHKQKIVYGYLRSAGSVNAPMVISFIGIWCVRVTLVYLFGNVLHLDIVWIWWAMNIDQWVREIIAESLFKRRKVLNYINIKERNRNILWKDLN